MMDAGRKLPVLSYISLPSFQCSDNANGRVFPEVLDDNSSLTTAGCIESCSALNYTIAGLEWSVQCMVRFTRHPRNPSWC